MEGISKVVILGGEEVGTKVLDLFSKAGLKAVIVDWKRDYSGELADADMVLEALPEDIETRKKALHECDEKAPGKTILATTASWGITEMGATTKRPQRFIGVNFTANPFEDKYLVQLAKGLETSEETMLSCKGLMEKIGAMVIELEDSPGLVLDRMLASVINEAALMYSSNLASIQDIDKITRLCLNWPMGPLEFADTLGIDKVVATLEVLSQQFGPQYIPCLLLKKMVATGRLGKKTGKGFYTYS